MEIANSLHRVELFFYYSISCGSNPIIEANAERHKNKNKMTIFNSATPAVEQAPAILVIDRNTEILHEQTVISVTSLVVQFSKEVLASILLGARIMVKENVSGSIRNYTALLLVKLAEMSVEGVANEFDTREVREIVKFLNRAVIFLITAQDDKRDEKIWAAKNASLELREAMLLTVMDRINLRNHVQNTQI